MKVYEIILKMVDSLLNFNNWGNQSLILKNLILFNSVILKHVIN